MILDIVSLDGPDLGLQQSEAPRAANVLSTQLGDLEYAKDFGVDTKFFLTSELDIPDASFKTYLVNRLLEHRINVVSVLETVHTFYRQLTIGVGQQETRGLAL